MCLKPYKIKNPNKGLTGWQSYLKDCESDFIEVPCGHCSVCLQLRQSYFVQRFHCESLDNDLWFCTLTYRNEVLPTCTINGYKHKYADPRDIQLFIKRIRKENVFGSEFKYVAISEYGGSKHRPHWHIMFSTPKIPGELHAHKLYREQKYKWSLFSQWYTNKGSRRNPIKFPNTIYISKNGRSNYDFHYVDPSLTQNGSSDVAFYSSKYLIKASKYVDRLRGALYHNLSGDDFRYYWNLLRPKSLWSKDWSSISTPSVKQYLRKCIDWSIATKQKFPCFINPVSGQSFPLSPYLRRVMTVDDHYAFRKINDKDYIPGSGVKLSLEYDLEDVRKKEQKFNHILKFIDNRDVYTEAYWGDDVKLDNSFFDGNFENNNSLDKKSTDSRKDFESNWNNPFIGDSSLF